MFPYYYYNYIIIIIIIIFHFGASHARNEQQTGGIGCPFKNAAIQLSADGWGIYWALRGDQQRGPTPQINDPTHTRAHERGREKNRGQTVKQGKT